MKLINFEERTVTIAGKKFLKPSVTQKFGDMRDVGWTICNTCNDRSKVISGYVGPGLNLLRIERRCKCGSTVDQTDFSKVDQILRVYARAKCEREFLLGIRKMENCCSGDASKCTPLEINVSKDGSAMVTGVGIARSSKADNLRYISNLSTDTTQMMTHLREAFVTLAARVEDLGESRELSLAHTHIEQALMYTIKHLCLVDPQGVKN